MMVEKFDKWDRKTVIRFLQETFCVTLSAVGYRDKWLRDNSGADWWIVGGKDDWHAFPEEMIDDGKSGDRDGYLVFSRKYTDSLDVYRGALQPLIDAKHNLSRNAHGDYQFMVDVKKDRVTIDKAPGVLLKKIGTIPHTDGGRVAAGSYPPAAPTDPSMRD